MTVKNVQLLSCPNSQNGDFRIFAKEILRAGQILEGISENELEQEDQIRTGVLINENSLTAFPIKEYITIMLSDQDVDTFHIIPMLEEAEKYASDEFKPIISTTLKRYRKQEETDAGKWNREEMRYYDSEVSTPEKRTKMVKHINTVPLWQIFIPRKKYLIDPIAEHCKNKSVLEVGCGNSRTISQLFPPNQNQYNYIGIDISWKRLLVAKTVIPEGSFIQASALNLPFKNKCFATIFGFGVYHHLPNHEQGYKSSLEKLDPNGYLAFHEPFEKTSRLINPEKYPFLIKLLTTYEHSEHDNEINLDKMYAEIKKCGFKPYKVRYADSVLRAGINLIIRKFPFLFKSKSVNQAVYTIDRIFLNTFCRRPNSLGPGGITIIVQGEQNNTN